MSPVSLFHLGKYSQDWVKDFYTQAYVWWGPDPAQEYYPLRVATVERLCGPGPKRILDLGAGSGGTAAALADEGHTVVAVELSPRIRRALELIKVPRKGPLTCLEADFYSVELGVQFDVVCYWDGFGVGSDADQRRILRRIAGEWLAPGGSVLLDVFNPTRFARHAGTEELLPPLEGVPGSVEMLHRCYYDPLHCQWLDEWQPTAEPEKALAQTIRCYTPADFLLLLQGTGLALKRIEVDGQALDLAARQITTSGPLMEAYSYLVQMEAGGLP